MMGKILNETQNILFIAPNYYPHIGGVEKHIRELAKCLTNDGHRVTIIVEKFDKNYINFEIQDNIRIYRIAKINKKCLKQLYYLYEFFKKIKLFTNATIIHFHDYLTLYNWRFIVYIFLRMMNKKIYITFHGWEGHFPPEKEVIKKRKQCEKIANGNICIGHYIEKWYGTKADIISYGGTHQVDEKASQNDEGNDIVFIGRLDSDTGILNYLKAWKEINCVYPEKRMIICGDGPLKSDLIKFVKMNKLTNVFFKGFVSNPEIFIQDAIIVLTSGYLGILEALAYKKAVIATYDNELKKDYLEMIPESSNMLWIAGNVNEIVLSIKEILKLDNNVRNKILNGYKFSLENNWDKVKNDYYELWIRK